MTQDRFSISDTRTPQEDLQLVSLACSGDKDALLRLIEPLQSSVYNLARRMVWDAQDAQDVTHEALIRIIVQLNKFRGEALFTTWAYRVAVHAILNTRRRRMEVPTISFEEFGDALDEALNTVSAEASIDPADGILVEEVKLSCMTGMLLCLNRPARLAYIVGEIFEVDHVLAADICGVAPATFRQRLSRARRALHDFVKARCGQASSEPRCRCHTMVGPAVASGKVNPTAPAFVESNSPSRASDSSALAVNVRQLDAAVRAVELFREHPSYRPRQGFEAWLKELLQGSELSGILESPDHVAIGSDRQLAAGRTPDR